ncbi:MAG: hypothetical protein NWE89_05190 [Candidatus Bathyarchaeota archaeon]|nr:hypothetical protein [Candidatus Bathyarchaeota archaeon]
MVHVEKKYETSFWVCDECGFGYEQREIAEMCEGHCQSNGVCSLVITKKAVLMPTYV